ncbi:SAF domain-containing protein [Solwaraspora sp. WMMD791]|uniref:SAF domain-containing protein n=1 Tax=Solwaraspora sp. WMMD791 TaxID=3016086 RepID=UPI002499B7AE|nr:SAF domain-containing protein [Solwaraspora sp. WMMD791]WFE30840.1 SAF domain-containing protein [Solwaraspora sp. WMMD791]
MPFVALGGLLVIVCVLSYAYGAAQLGDRVQVLAVARPVAAGQAITAADLTQVSAARDPGVRLVPAVDAVEVVGHTAVVPLVAGMLLTPEVLGDAAFPPGGQVTASVAVKPGQYPQGLAAGARVAVYVSATVRGDGQPDPTASSAAAPERLSAVVLGVDLAGDGQGATVITLLLDASDAPVLAAAPAGGVVLMQTSPVEG